MASKDKQLQTKVEDEIKKYNNLKTAFLSIYDTEKAVQKKRNESYESINKIEEVDNTELSNIYKQFFAKMNELEAFRTRHLKNINEKFLPMTEYYPEKLKMSKKSITELIDLKKQKEKNAKEEQKEKNKNEVDKIKTLSATIAQQTEMERRKTQDIEKNVCLIEADRVKDNKYLFLHYIHSELEYHAKAVEKLSQLFNQINVIEPLEKMPEFMRSYNIKADLREINIDMEEIERNKERRLKYQADQVNKVFGKDSNENKP